MIYAMTFYDAEGLEGWDSSTCQGIEADGPFEAIKKEWGHCWLDDPATDRERLLDWLDGEGRLYEFHVIAQNGEHWLVAFDVEPLRFESDRIPGSRHKPRRRVIWTETNVKVELAPTEHAAEYPANWKFYTAEMVAAELAASPHSDIEEGWWIENFEACSEEVA